MKVESMSLTESIISYTNDNSKAQQKVEEECSVLKYTKSIAVGVVILVAGYSVFFLIISHSAGLENDETTAGTRGTNLISGIPTCGADSFMLRDSVCDEATNTELCRYDGGDCCLEIKDTTMCRNCSCILAVDADRLKDQFNDLLIKPVRKSIANDIQQVNNAIKDWIVSVDEVVSGHVCAVLCLDHDQENSINAWRYNNNAQVCKCGWVSSMLCPEETLVKPDWKLRDLGNLLKYNIYMELRKTVFCECQAKGVLLNGTRTIANRKEQLDASSVSSSLTMWHCQQNCQLDKECTIFSWRSSGECRHFTESPMDNVTSISNDCLDWVSSTDNCDRLSEYFNIDNDGGPEIFDHNLKDSLLIITTGYQHNDGSFLNKTQIFAIDSDMGTLSNLTVNGLDLSVRLSEARGGLIKSTTGLVYPIICGGFVQNEQSTLATNRDCYSLTDSLKPVASYSDAIRAFAPVAVVNERTALWIVGGGPSGDRSTEIIDSMNNYESTTTDHSFPDIIKDGFKHHCLVILKSNQAILFGGLRGGYLSRETFRIDLNNPHSDWKQSGIIAHGRYGHMCGVLKSDNDGIEVIVAAGGFKIIPTAHDTSDLVLDSVEALKVTDGQVLNNWQPVESMLMPVAFAATATTHDQDRMFVAGGETGNCLGNHCQLQTIISLACSDFKNLLCQWTIISEVQLSSPRSRMVAYIVPPYLRLSGVSYKNTPMATCDD